MLTFRNIELSDPGLEVAGLRFLTFRSPALGRRGDVSLFVPPGCQGLHDLPLVVLLHGVYGSHWAWPFKGGAHGAALTLIESGAIRPMVLAMPSDGLWGDGSGYVRHGGADYEAWILRDVVECVSQVVPQVSERAGLFLTGLSMGGYGALRMGARHGGRIDGISAHSSITHLDQIGDFVTDPVAEYEVSPPERAALHWIVTHRDQLPPLRFDCGIDDPLRAANQALDLELTRRGIPHEYHEFPGGHEWSYWVTHVSDTLIFFEACLAAAQGRARVRV